MSNLAAWVEVALTHTARLLPAEGPPMISNYYSIIEKYSGAIVKNTN
jgi:hypothetical protein